MGWKMTAIAAAALLAPAAPSGDVLFFDDFSDGVADGWFELPLGAVYTVENGWYCFDHTAPDEAVAGASNGDQGGSMSVADYSMRVTVIPRAGFVGLAVRFTGILWQGYMLAIDPETDMAAIIRFDGFTADPTILSGVPHSLEYGQQYWLRFEVSGQLLGGKIWQGSPEDEPSSWLLLAQDSSYQSPGAIGLGAMDIEEGSTAVLDADFDEVEVTDDISLSLTQSTWARVKRLGPR
ncbi:hypothetical protein JW921_03685 [Candidatus Fermentibacterales bacterium]|nr:hypothetical protein [Candidatus Fermentibacterales bacterium]